LGGLAATLMLRFGGGDRFSLDKMEAALDELGEELEALDGSSAEPAEATPAETVEESTETETNTDTSTEASTE
jgi:hypothetical protein